MKKFAEELRLAYPSLAQLRPEFDRLKRGLYKNNLGESIPEPTTAALIEVLPSRAAVDELIGLYMTYIDPAHRILHVPSFLRDLDDFWTRVDNPAAIPSAFVVQLLLMLACAWNLADPETLRFKNEGRLKCYTAVKWIVMVEKWIQGSHIKRPDITAFRIQCLLIMAQNSQGVKRSRAWLATGTLTKQAMLAGYHRDPGTYSKISAFNKEMRRRVWTTIVELDLQVALDRGLPPSVQASDYDSAPVLNIDDNEISESSVDIPPERPLDQVTDSSFQAVLSRSLPLRLKTCAMMHSPRITCTYEDILHVDWEFNKHLSQIPSWNGFKSWDRRLEHRIILWKAALENKIAQSLLCLHTPFAIEAAVEPLFVPSARARLDVATNILATQRRLHGMSIQLSLCCLGDWTIQAAASVCQLLYTGDGRHRKFTPNSVQLDLIANRPLPESIFLPRLLPEFSETLLSLVDTVLLSLETRLLLVAKGAKEYFYLSAVLATVKTKLWPEQATVARQQVVDRLLELAQSLFNRHACCSRLGNLAVGGLVNQVSFMME